MIVPHDLSFNKIQHFVNLSLFGDMSAQDVFIGYFAYKGPWFTIKIFRRLCI